MVKHGTSLDFDFDSLQAEEPEKDSVYGLDEDKQTVQAKVRTMNKREKRKLLREEKQKEKEQKPDVYVSTV